MASPLDCLSPAVPPYHQPKSNSTHADGKKEALDAARGKSNKRHAEQEAEADVDEGDASKPKASRMPLLRWVRRGGALLHAAGGQQQWR